MKKIYAYLLFLGALVAGIGTMDVALKERCPQEVTILSAQTSLSPETVIFEAARQNQSVLPNQQNIIPSRPAVQVLHHKVVTRQVEKLTGKTVCLLSPLFRLSMLNWDCRTPGTDHAADYYVFALREIIV